MRQFTSQLKKFTSPIQGVEVGVEKGDNALEILQVSTVQMLYLVDIWSPFIQEGQLIWNPEFCEGDYNKVQGRFGLDSRVTILRKSSSEAAREISSLDFVYLDACHEYQAVVSDINTWLPKVKRGGILGGHDFSLKYWPGVVRAVVEFTEKYGLKLEHAPNPNANVDDWWVWL